MSWKEHGITERKDGSFVVTLDGLPCHVPDEGEFKALHAEVKAFAAANPGKVGKEAPRPEPTREEMVEGFTWSIQQRMDTFARSEGKAYDGMLSLCTYATSKDPVFAAEGQYGVEVRDATWKAANKVLNAVLAGERDVPTWEEMEAELPELKWPEIGKH